MADAFPCDAPYHVSCLKGLAVSSIGYYRKHSLCRQCRIYWTISFFLTQSESEYRGYVHQFQTVADYVGIPKHNKTVHPVTCVTVHGIDFDTNMM